MAEVPAEVNNIEETTQHHSPRERLKHGNAEASTNNTEMRPHYSKLDQHQDVETSDASEKLKRMEGAFRTILECVNEDPDREGLVRTPARAAKAMMFFTKGYEDTLASAVSNGVFHEEHNDMVIVKGINMFSLCEHHLVPFYGTVSVAYLPSNKVLGLSKLARIVEVFSRRLQLQERLTREIATGIMESIQPSGVAVVIEASHMCMVMRGVEKPGSKTVTSTMLGVFRDDPRTRHEFLHLITNSLSSGGGGM